MLVYRLLKAANLPTRDEQLVKVTITELKYDSVISKLIKIFSDNCEVPTSEFNNMHIKTEPVYHTQSYPEDNTFDQTNYQNEDPELQYEYVYENDNERQNEHHTLTHVTMNIQSKQKATSHTNNHFNAETNSNLTTINKITNNKIINNQVINDHNH